MAYAACAAALCSSEPMKRSSSTPPMFIAMPCTPVGKPKRNSDRMIAQSGRQSMWREKWITQSPRNRCHSAYTLTSPDAMAVPSAEPAVPSAGIGPKPRISSDVEDDVQHRHRHAQPQRRPRIARGAHAPPSA